MWGPTSNYGLKSMFFILWFRMCSKVSPLWGVGASRRFTRNFQPPLAKLVSLLKQRLQKRAFRHRAQPADEYLHQHRNVRASSLEFLTSHTQLWYVGPESYKCVPVNP